jgi:glucose-6-phosphate isomerase
MKELHIKNSIHEKYLNNITIKGLSKKFKQSFKKINLDIEDKNKTLNVLSKNFKFNLKVRDLKSFKKYKSVVIIGMGGSILGAEAIYEFLGEKVKKTFYFFDDINLKKNRFFKKKKNINKVLFIIISKSGNTIETLSNFLSLNILKKNSKNIIVISEKNNNLLYLISKKFNLFYIEHKKNIGGRFSVLSEVGIVPAYLMGVNISKLRFNTLKYLRKKNFFILKDSVVKLANLLNSKKIKNIILLNYAPELEKFLFWCQQLLAESLGKNNRGFLPMISSAPRDHHSLLQLYLDGPKDKLFYIFSAEDQSSDKIVIPKNLENISFLHNKKLQVIKKAQKKALIKTFKNNNIPYREFAINDLNENVIGELFSYFILETILVADLTNVNPYDQPSVEQVKYLTNRILS